MMQETPKQPLLLLVDDDDGVRRTLSALLELCGYSVVAVASGAEGLRVARTNTGLVAMLTDVHMPNMSGIELVSELVLAGIHLPVLFLSGQADAELPDHWPRDVPRHFLPKPFTPDVLARELQELLAKR